MIWRNATGGRWGRSETRKKSTNPRVDEDEGTGVETENAGSRRPTRWQKASVRWKEDWNERTYSWRKFVVATASMRWGLSAARTVEETKDKRQAKNNLIYLIGRFPRLEAPQFMALWEENSLDTWSTFQGRRTSRWEWTWGLTRHTKKNVNWMHFVLALGTNEIQRFLRQGKLKDPFSGSYVLVVPSSFVREGSLCSFPHLPLHVQVSCFLISQSSSFRSSRDLNIFLSFLLLASFISRHHYRQHHQQSINHTSW
jgi:hypothetical protein